MPACVCRGDRTVGLLQQHTHDAVIVVATTEPATQRPLEAFERRGGRYRYRSRCRRCGRRSGGSWLAKRSRNDCRLALEQREHLLIGRSLKVVEDRVEIAPI